MAEQITIPIVTSAGGESGRAQAAIGSFSLENAGPATLALHADEPLQTDNDIAPAIHVSTTFRYPDDPDKLKPFYGRVIEPTEFIYSRESSGNSTRLEAILSALLKAPCLTYSSGLAAIHAVLVLLSPKRVSIGDGYHGTHGVVDIHRRLTGCQKLPLSCPEEELSEGDLICLETPVNPTGLALDISHHAEKAHRRGAYLMVDSTFGPPPLQDPFAMGADLVMHSGTKYIGGHSDLLCGVIATKNREWISRLAEDRVFLGSVLGSLEGFLGIRSIRTLQLRVQRQSQNATFLVEALDGSLTNRPDMRALDEDFRKNVKAVVSEIKHASLQHEDKNWLSKQMPVGFGPVFALLMKTESFAKRLPSKLNLFAHATSLGGVESLVEWRTMSDPTTPQNLLRFSIGIEDAEDLLKDLVQGFRALLEKE